MDDQGSSSGDSVDSEAALARKKAIRSAINRRHYQKVSAARRKQEYAAFRAFIDAYKLDRGCVDCGYSENAAALDFDHIDPSEKAGTIARMFTYTRQRLLAELAKCEVRCANCHRIKTVRAKETGKQGSAAWDRPGNSPDPRKQRTYRRRSGA